jgi:hypothetical protein
MCGDPAQQRVADVELGLAHPERGGDQFDGGVQYFGAAGAIIVCVAGNGRHLWLPHNTSNDC